MAKKFGKFLLFTAAVGAVAAGAYYYLQTKTEKPLDEDDDFDDFDDFDDDLDEEEEEDAERSYFSVDLENAKEETVTNVTQTVQNTAEQVEEFFDDDDNSSDAI